MNKILFGIMVCVVLLAGAITLFKKDEPVPQPTDPRNISYLIDNEEVLLVGGINRKEAAPSSASVVTTQYFGNEAHGDINADGFDDVVFILTRDVGGSGVFFYVAAALKTADGYRGTNAVFIGDRIAPQTTAIEGGEIVVNYADRASNEPTTASPSLGISKYFTFSSDTLTEVVKPPKNVVQLYYYNADRDKDEAGNVQCSRAGLVAVERELPLTETPIHDTLLELLRGIVTEEERASGLASGFPLEGVTLVGEHYANGVLTLDFTDPEHKTSGGACRAGLLWMQIEETAKQFPEITRVQFSPSDLFQP